jgi:hypothetical protein
LSLGVHHQRIDVDLGQLRNGLHQPADGHDNLRDRLDVRRQRAAEAGEQLGRAQLAQCFDDLRGVGIGGKRLHVAERFDPDAAQANKEHGAPARVTLGAGNPAGGPVGSRHRQQLNGEFIAALLRDFRQGGPKAIERVRRTQPAAYLKILALLMPREHKVEHRNPVKDMTDEELEAAIEFIKKMLAAQAENAKVIDGAAEPTALAFPTEFEQPQRKRSNRLLEHVDTAIGPTRKPR